MQDEALFQCGTSREIPPFLLSLEGVLNTFDATQEVCPSPLERNTNVPTTTQEEPRFSLLISRGGSISLLHRERNPSIPVPPQDEAISNRKSSRTPRVMPQFQKTPMSQSTPDIPDSPAQTRLSPRDMTQNTMARVTALWPLKRQPHIPMSTRQEA